MKNILVPIDFTDSSKNALRYAMSMSKEEANITVLHCAMSQFEGLLKKPLLLSSTLDDNEGIKKDLLDFVSEVQQNSSAKSKINLKVGIGKISDCILIESNQSAYDYIVMGLRDHYKAHHKLFGSHAIQVSRNTNVPTLLIPPTCTYSEFKKVSVASDWHLTNDMLVEQLMNWNDEHQAFFHFLHVADKNDIPIAENVVEEFGEREGLFAGFEWNVINDSNIVNGIITKSKELSADLIILFHDKRIWLVDLLKKSISHDVITKSGTPIMILPTGSEVTNPIIGHIFSLAV